MVLFLIILWWTKSPVKFSFTRSVQSLGMLTMLATTVLPASIFQTASAAEPAAVLASATDTIDARVIREGTAIPPTPGRVVMLGRRWGFVPDETTQLHQQRNPNGTLAVIPSNGTARRTDEVGDSIRLKQNSSVRFASSTFVFNGPADSRTDSSPARKTSDLSNDLGNLRPAATSFAELTRARRMMTPAKIVTTRIAKRSTRGLRQHHQFTKLSKRNSAVNFLVGHSGYSPVNNEMITKKQGEEPLVLAENLMLQRVVDAVRNDSADDHWILSGVVTEFFGRNRMVIKTAQRSNAE